MAMSKRRWICTLIMFGKVFAYDTFISALPAFFVLEIPEVIGVKPLFIIACIDLITMTYVNLRIFRQYYLRLKKNKLQYFIFSLLCLALYFAIFMFVCMKLDYRVGIYLYLPLGLFNYFKIPWKSLILIFFIPMLSTIIVAPYMRKFIDYIFANREKNHENF